LRWLGSLPSGYLDRKEFKGCMQSSELGLSKKEIRRIMSEADENADGRAGPRSS
jgi:Ca2+-binding EF-hand superfamily protein